MNNHTEIPITTNSNNINNPNNPYVHISPAPPSSASNNNNRPNQTLDSICDGFNRCSRTVEKAARHAENMVDNFWNHIRISSSPADAAMARIVQGTRALTNGGSDKLFQQTFGFVPGERLLKPFACYISTTSGPVIGTLYVSNKRVAFCSDYPICHHPMSFQHHRSSCIYYKVLTCPYLIALLMISRGLFYLSDWTFCTTCYHIKLFIVHNIISDSSTLILFSLFNTKNSTCAYKFR
ncbi:GEM-like protein [Arachis hypogaea]|nr:GEM-like protein [Arachis hypogaea]